MSIDSKTVWNNIVQRYNKKKFLEEYIIQKEWEDIFQRLGYFAFDGEIVSQKQIHIGSRQREIPDIILKKEGKEIADIELKRYYSEFNPDMQKQLISYLNQLHLSIGVLVCSKLYLFSYTYENSNVQKIEIPFVENSPEGIKFVELFYKSNFSIEKIKTFIHNKNSFSNNVRNIESSISNDFLVDLIKNHFKQKYSYSIDEIESALSNLKISVSSKSDLIEQPTAPITPYPPARIGTSGLDTTKYIFNYKKYGKGKLVLAVVQQYIKDNPNTSATLLMTVFPKGLQGSIGVVKPVKDTHINCQDPQKRFFLDNDSIIHTTTEDCAVCSQWGIGNINNFIDKAKKLGYEIISTQ